MSYDIAMQRETLKSGEDVDAILRIALQEEHGSADELRQRLTRSAEDLGISPEALAHAEKVYLAESRLAESRSVAESHIDRFMKAKRIGFNSHLITFFSTNLMLHVIWYLTSRDFYWPGIVMAAWGVGLASHFAFVKQRPSVDEPDLKRWLALGQPSKYTHEDSLAKAGVTVGVHVGDKGKALEERE